MGFHLAHIGDFYDYIKRLNVFLVQCGITGTREEVVYSVEQVCMLLLNGRPELGNELDEVQLEAIMLFSRKKLYLRLLSLTTQKLVGFDNVFSA